MRRVRRANLLVIDDEPHIGNFFVRFFERDHDVVCEPEAAAALARLVAGERFDVIFCDVMMPGMTGPAFVGAVATRFPEQFARIVVITGGALRAEVSRFLAETRCRVLHKPFLLGELEAVVLEMVSERYGPRRAPPRRLAN